MSRTRSATLVHEGGMRFAATTGTKRTIVYGDVIEQGELSPVETIAVSLGACSAMDVISIALKKRQGVEGYVVHARAEQRDAYPKILTRIDLVHEVVGSAIDTEAIERCIELSATKYCPVSAMLSSGATEIHHAYRIVRPDQPVEEGEVLVTGPFRPADPIEP